MYCSRCGTLALDSDTLCANCGAALQIDREPMVLTAAPAPVPIWQPLYAGFWRRFATWLVDYVVWFPFFGAFRILVGVGPAQGFDWSRELLLVLAVEECARWIYSAVLESSRWQGTLGQMLLGVRVSDVHGRRIGFLRATVRHFGQLLSIFTLGIGYLMVAFHPRKQALHDLIAGCVIVRDADQPHVAEAPRPAPPPAPGPGLTPLGGAS